MKYNHYEMTRSHYHYYYKTTLETALENGDMPETITDICWAIAEEQSQKVTERIARLEELFEAYREVLNESRYREE